MVKNRKKILFIITQSDFGGAQRYVFDLATNLDANKFEILVSAGREGDKILLKRLKEKSIKTFLLKNLKRSIHPYFDLLAFFEIRNLIQKFKPDIIHLNSAKAGILGSLATQFYSHHSHAYSHNSHRVIYTAHGWTFNEPLPAWQKNLYIFLEKFTAKFKNKIICVSEYDRQVALQNDIAPENKLITIHNGIDLKNFKFLPVSSIKYQVLSKKEKKDKIIGCVANLYKTKGIEYLIRAFKILNTKYLIHNTKLIIIGEGSERKNLESQIKNYNLQDCVFLMGNVPDAAQYLKAFDIFVLPSVKEGFPYAILEAMRAGLPIVATKVSGVPEAIKNNENGLLAPPQNATALAKRINYLLKNPATAKKLGKTNLKIVKDFSLEKMLKETEAEYQI